MDTIANDLGQMSACRWPHRTLSAALQERSWLLGGVFLQRPGEAIDRFINSEAGEVGR